jgi:hypothetical protein
VVLIALRDVNHFKEFRSEAAENLDLTVFVAEER